MATPPQTIHPLHEVHGEDERYAFQHCSYVMAVLWFYKQNSAMFYLICTISSVSLATPSHRLIDKAIYVGLIVEERLKRITG